VVLDYKEAELRNRILPWLCFKHKKAGTKMCKLML